MSKSRAIAITMGDPAGIGPEVVVKALADETLRTRATFDILGWDASLRRAAAAAGLTPYWRRAGEADAAPGVVIHETAPIAPAQSPIPPADTAVGGEASFRFVDAAIERALRAGARAVVTAPISKRAWALAGHSRWPGHTELFAERFGADRHAMMFVSPRLRVVLVTVHTPLRDVAGSITTERALNAIELGAAACARLSAPGARAARIGVCGLNPHAGEGGLLGDEDQRLIAPAVARAKQLGIDAHGPLPADTLFVAAARGDFDLVVAMYHDQGLIPVKLLGWESAVNLTLGLPIVRTSPDHGTAFDIAWKNAADPRSMRAAIELALRLTD